jgi:hypothetical protein
METGGESLPEWILLRVSFFLQAGACRIGTAVAAPVGLALPTTFLERVSQRHP